jgi:AcrR family transcriptional regulator
MRSSVIVQQESRVRHKLITSANRLFNRQGYAATSVREIVAASGVTKPVLYHYFGNKEGLYREIIKRVLDHFEGQLEAFRKHRGSARERVLELCDGMFSLFLEHADSVRLIYSIYYGPPQGAPHIDFDAFYAKLYGAVRQAVQQGIRSGEFHRGNPDDLTQVILGALTVAVESHLAHNPVYIGNRRLGRILEQVFQGILADNTKRKGQQHAGKRNRPSSSSKHRDR